MSVHVRYTYIDRDSGLDGASGPVAIPTEPALPGLQFVFARESQYPAVVPELFGICDTAPADTPGLLAVLSEAEFEAALAAELAARLAVAQARLIEQIEIERRAAERRPFAFRGVLVDADPASALRILARAEAARAALVAAEPFAVRWEASGTTLDLDAAGVQEMAVALAAHHEAAHANARALKAAVRAITDPADVDHLADIDIFAGWPGAAS